jgi:hypothetical protein
MSLLICVSERVKLYKVSDSVREVAIFAIDFSGHPVRKISKNHATANAFGCFYALP